MSGRRKIFAALISVLALVALGVSVYLTWVTWQSGTVAGCTAGSLLDCDDVLTSRWSKWFGLPVSLLGAVCYLAILFLCWPAATRPQGLAMTGLFALAMVAAGAAVWFVGLQALQLHSFCFYCLTVHSCGLAVGVLALLLFLDTSGANDYDQMRSLLGVAAMEPGADAAETVNRVSGLRLLGSLGVSAVGLSLLMGGQLLSKSDEVMPLEEVSFEPLETPSQATPSQATQSQTTQSQTTQSQTTQSQEGQSDESETSADLAADEEQEQGEFVIVTDQPTDWLEEETAVTEEPDSLGSLFDTGNRQVTFQALPKAVDVTAMPVVGNPQAKHVLLEMMDYTCKHCRRLHPHLQASLDHYGDQLAVVIYHVPLSKKCNPNVQRDSPGKKNACEYARLAIGVWQLAPEKFPEFHDWLLESEKPPNLRQAKNRAMRLVGEAIFLDKSISVVASKRITKQCTTMQKLKSGLPVLLLTNGAIRGVPEESQKLFDFFEHKLGVEPLVATVDQ